MKLHRNVFAYACGLTVLTEECVVSPVTLMFLSHSLVFLSHSPSNCDVPPSLSPVTLMFLSTVLSAIHMYFD